MHPECFSFVGRTLRSLPPRQAVVDLGGRDVNGSPRTLFREAKRYVAVDIRDGPGVDVVAGATQYRPRWRADTVVCCEVLEHSEYGPEIIANAYRILAPGGYLIATAAGVGRQEHSAVDGMGLREHEWYRNIEEAELDGWLRGVGFTDITIEVDDVAHDIRCVARKAQPMPKTALDIAVQKAGRTVVGFRWRPGYDAHRILIPEEIRDADPMHPHDCADCRALIVRFEAERAAFDA